MAKGQKGERDKRKTKRLINNTLFKQAAFIGGKILLLLSLITGLLLLTYHLLFWQRVYLGVAVAELYLGGKTQKQSLSLVQNIKPQEKVILTALGKEFILETADIELAYNLEDTIHQAFLVGRSDNIKKNFIDKWQGLTREVKIGLVVRYNQSKLAGFLQEVSDMLFIPSIEPKVLAQKGEILVEEGKEGQAVDQEQLMEKITNAFAYNNQLVSIPVDSVHTKLTPGQVEEIKTRAQKLVGVNLTLVLEDNKTTFKDENLVNFLAPGYSFNEEKITAEVDKIATQFSRPVQNPAFRFETSPAGGQDGRVTEFAPAKDGLEVNKDKLKQKIIEVLQKVETSKSEDNKNLSLDIPATRTKSKITTGEVNNLGIKELIGKGTSRFRGSIASRIHNITLATSRLNGLLIPPGEVFSFNNALGDVSAFTGYQQAYIIKDGKTILGDGGGVCQVSSTLFRAALKTGLPIIERRAHSYRVSYYEQDSGPGFDATVYSPTPHLKIKNDTPSHILIQASVDRKNLTLTLELYGTSDGRVTTTTKPRVWDLVEPLPDLYQDDPTLPAGKIKQVDFKAWGSKASFDYQVERGSEVLQNRTFYSAYRPWQAVYLRGIAQ